VGWDPRPQRVVASGRRPARHQGRSGRDGQPPSEGPGRPTLLVEGMGHVVDGVRIGLDQPGDRRHRGPAADAVMITGGGPGSACAGRAVRSAAASAFRIASRRTRTGSAISLPLSARSCRCRQYHQRPRPGQATRCVANWSVDAQRTSADMRSAWHRFAGEVFELADEVTLAASLVDLGAARRPRCRT